MKAIVLIAFLGCALAASVQRLKRETDYPPRPTPAPVKRPDQDGEDASKRVRRAAGDTVTVCLKYTTANLNDEMISNINSAIAAFEDVSCLDIVLNDNCQSSYGGKIVHVDGKDDGCRATIGFINGNPEINLADECDTYGDGVIIHEIFHVLGRYHEHVRSDRDIYVQVVSENIQSGKEHNFQIQEGQTYDVRYDYESIMHYGRDFFTNGNGDTLKISHDMYKDKVGKQRKLSPLDVVTVNMMFICYTDSIDPYDCDHGGVRMANGNCLCMEPFKGDRCETVDSDKATHVVNTGSQTINAKTPNYPENYPVNTDQNIVFECPSDYKARIKFLNFALEGWGCGYDKISYTSGAADIYPNIGCGTMLDGTVHNSTDEIIFLKFHSDELYTYKGYSVEFTCFQ